VGRKIPRTYPVLYFLYWLFIRAGFSLLTRWHVSGAENVPEKGTCLLASNHISMLDPPLAYGSTKRWLYGLTTATSIGSGRFGPDTTIPGFRSSGFTRVSDLIVGRRP
jgi:hypothetical protein